MAGRDLENKNKPEKQGEALSYTTQYIKSQRKNKKIKIKQKEKKNKKTQLDTMA